MTARNMRLPDVINEDSSTGLLPLQWVGMEGISIPIFIKLNKTELEQVTAKVDCYVSLDKKQAKGIHMSRIHCAINNCLTKQCVTNKKIITLLNEMISSHYEYSSSAMINFTFELPILKKSLVSEESGFQSYSISMNAMKVNQYVSFTLEITIPYSSTCPCSAALSRESMSDALDKYFVDSVISKNQLLQWVKSNAGQLATPHSQRSYAYLKIVFSEKASLEVGELIDSIENVISTPVQAVVKRQDEQAFAELNGKNLMFCEDVARRVKNLLESFTKIEDYWYKIEHQESLHAHNAVVIDCKKPY